MAIEKKKYVDSAALQHLLEKLRDKNAALFLEKTAEAASAAKVKNALTLTVGENDVVFDGSEAKSTAVAAKVHTHKSTDISDFAAAVKKAAFGDETASMTAHAHDNKATLDKLSDAMLDTWNAKISVDDVARIKYENTGMTSVKDVKGALDILVKNAQINTAALTDTSANMNSLATKIGTLETDMDQAQTDIDALEAKVGDDTKGLVKDVADLKAANAEGGAVANAIKDAKDAADAAQTSADEAKAAVATEKGRAEGVEAGLQGEIDAIKNVDTGILAQAKAYTDAREVVLDGKITKAQSAADKAQGEVDALEGVVGTAADTADKTTVFGKIAKAQAQADKGVQDAATEKSRAQGVEAGLRTDLGQATDAAKADGSAFARIAQVKADLTAEANRATGIEQGLRTDVDAAQDAIDILNGGVDQEGSVDKKIADKISEVNTAAGNLEKRVKANEDAITVINGDGEGSIKDAVAKLVNGAPEAMDTLNELANAITEHESTYQAYVAQVAKDIAAAKQEAITTAGTNADTKDQTLHTTITGEIATAKSEAISAAASKDSALETKLQGKIDLKADQTALETEVNRATAAEQANASAIATLNGDVNTNGSVKKQIEAVRSSLQANIDAKVAQEAYNTKVAALEAADSALSDRIAKFEEGGENSVAAQVKAVQDDLDAHKEAQVIKEKAVDDKLAVIQGEANVEGSIKKALADAKSYTDTREAAINGLLGGKEDAAAVDTAFGRIAKEVARATAAEEALANRATALETKVGDSTKGLVKDVADLKTTVGNAQSGLVKDVADLKSIDAGTRLTAAETSIDTLEAWVAAHGTITNAELDAMLNDVYGPQA